MPLAFISSIPLPLLSSSHHLSFTPTQTLPQISFSRFQRAPPRVRESCIRMVQQQYSTHRKSSPTLIKPSAKPKVTAEGDSLESTPLQRLMLSTFAVATVSTYAQLFSQLTSPLQLVSYLASILAAYIFTDFAVGVYHHAVDNYGNKHTPVVGFQIEAFQGHHQFPWTITSRDMPNNLHSLTKVTLPQMLALFVLPLPAEFKALYAPFLVFIVLSQETHRQAHMTRAAPWVRSLQNAGIIISKNSHAAHHKGSAAFEGNYCILSGWWNRTLDRSGFFRTWEAVIHRVTGNEPICWRLDPSLKQISLVRLPKSWR